MDGVERVDTDRGEANTAGEEGRDRQRDSLFLSARMRLAGAPGEHEVRVRNLSAGGLMAEFAKVVAPGVAVTLEIRGLGEVGGSVAWCTHGRLGIALDHPIDPQRARKPVGAGATTPGYAKPVFVARAPRRN